MTTVEAERLAARIFAAFPDVELRPETEATFVRFLVDLDYAKAEQAIEDAISTSVTMPRIGAIRRRVIEEEMVLPTAAEAWTAANERGVELHELAREARNLLGGAWAIRTSDNPGVTRAQYLKIFEELRERALLEANRASRRCAA